VSGVLCMHAIQHYNAKQDSFEISFS